MTKKKNAEGTSKRGFASMSPERLSEVSRAGGQASHRYGQAHEFNREEASAAGKKGGLTVSRDRAHMSRIGKLGGKKKASDEVPAAKTKAPSPKVKAPEVEEGEGADEADVG